MRIVKATSFQTLCLQHYVLSKWFTSFGNSLVNWNPIPALLLYSSLKGGGAGAITVGKLCRNLRHRSLCISAQFLSHWAWKIFASAVASQMYNRDFPSNLFSVPSWNESFDRIELVQEWYSPEAEVVQKQKHTNLQQTWTKPVTFPICLSCESREILSSHSLLSISHLKCCLAYSGYQ